MNPDIEATFCDWLQNVDCDWIMEIAYTPRGLNNLFTNFLSKYAVEDWGIRLQDFSDFLQDVAARKRCRLCGEKEFPYFMSGDKECVRCLT